MLLSGKITIEHRSQGSESPARRRPGGRRPAPARDRTRVIPPRSPGRAHRGTSPGLAGVAGWEVHPMAAIETGPEVLTPKPKAPPGRSRAQKQAEQRQKQAQRAATLLKHVSDATRLQVILILSEGER